MGGVSVSDLVGKYVILDGDKMRSYVHQWDGYVDRNMLNLIGETLRISGVHPPTDFDEEWVDVVDKHYAWHSFPVSLVSEFVTFDPNDPTNEP